MNKDELNTILLKVKTLYEKYGIKSVTMDDVARELGISKKTLYQCVKDKDELVERISEIYELENEKLFEEIKDKKLNAIQSLLLVNIIAAKMVKNYNPGMEYDLKKYHQVVYTRIKDRIQKKMYKSVLDNLKQGKAEGLYRENLNEEIIAKMYVLRMDSLMDCELISREEMLKPKFTDQITEYHIRGIANEKGIAEYEKNKKKYNNDNNIL
ncbi:MAG: TetR/AcrR family transcriptional regulator [Bacteroidales bacterium]|nr:TetR/AcrR family transcriptional regulator [Bacteroidales bacterium]